jgi:hypothetical protein
MIFSRQGGEIFYGEFPSMLVASEERETDTADHRRRVGLADSGSARLWMALSGCRSMASQRNFYGQKTAQTPWRARFTGVPTPRYNSFRSGSSSMVE